MARTKNIQPTYWGFNAPFWGGQNNVMSRQEDQQLIKNDLLQLLQTSPGERVHRPTFGTLIRSTLFNPLDGSTAAILRQNIIQQITTYEPRVVTQSVDISSDPLDDQRINIKIIVNPKYDPLIEFLIEMTFNSQA